MIDEVLEHALSRNEPSIIERSSKGKKRGTRDDRLIEIEEGGALTHILKRNDYHLVCPPHFFPQRIHVGRGSVHLIVIITPVPQLRSPRIWGTLSASGGVGATTLTFHLARVAAASGVRVLVIESDLRTPLRQILNSQPPFWEDYRAGASIPNEALPATTGAGFALLTRRSSAELNSELLKQIVDVAVTNFDLVLLDNPSCTLPMMNALVVVENTLPSLFGLNHITQIYRPTIAIINKFRSRKKSKVAIEGFISDATLFRFPKSAELQLALGFGITRKLSKTHENNLGAIVREMLY